MRQISSHTSTRACTSYPGADVGLETRNKRNETMVVLLICGLTGVCVTNNKLSCLIHKASFTKITAID